MLIESEKVLEKKLSEAVKRAGGLSIKLISIHFIGLPDRLCLLPKGRLFFIEMKTTGKKPSKIQTIIHAKFDALGFPVLVIDTTEKINDFIKTL